MQQTVRHATLPVRDLVCVQVAHLRTRFELAERSLLAEKVAHATNETLERWETEHGIARVHPGELYLSWKGKPLYLRLLSPTWSRKLQEGLSPAAVRRHLEHEQLAALQALDGDATVEDLWRLVSQDDLARGRGKKSCSFLPDEPLAAEQLSVFPRRPEDAEVPEEVLRPVVAELVANHGCRPAQAEAMVKIAAQLRSWCCPKTTELQPGQLVWLSLATRKTRRQDPKLLVPVVLTLLTPAEMDMPLEHRGQLKQLKMA